MDKDILAWMTFAGPLVLAVVMIMVLARLRGRKESRVNLSKYSLRESVLTMAETRFFSVLGEVVGTKYSILIKPRMLDIFEISSGDGYQAAMNRISQKHIDFLLCEPITFEPILAIELDDLSHLRKDRQERDEFVDSLFDYTGLKVLHIPASKNSEAEDLRDKIIVVLRSNGGK